MNASHVESVDSLGNPINRNHRVLNGQKKPVLLGMRISRENPLLLPQNNPHRARTAELGQLDRLKTVREGMTQPVTKDPANKAPSPFFQILGTKFVQTVRTKDGTFSRVVHDYTNTTPKRLQRLARSGYFRFDKQQSGRHSPETRNDTADLDHDNVHADGQSTVSQATVLQSLVVSQFSWVDVIIAVGCTAAVLLILVNLGVCIRIVRRQGKHIRVYEPPPPAPHTYRLRMDNLRAANSISPATSAFSVGKSNKKKKKSGTGASPNSTSLSSGKTNLSLLSVVSDAATQYESMDAMLASFISSELIVELNDRDSTCTSLSDGFTFSRDYLNARSADLNDVCTEF